MFDLFTMIVIAGTFFLAGSVKGVVGLGLPTVSLGLLTVAFDLPVAMALLVVPSLVTNLWQASVGGNGRVVLVRIWPFLLLATVSIWIGSSALTRMDLSQLSALLGVVLMAYASLNLSGISFKFSPRSETWAGPLFGTINGILTGMTGSFVVPGVMYLQAIGLSRDMLVQAMGMLFSVSTIALAIALQQRDLLTGQLGLVSAAAVLPAIAGMIAGRKIRRRLTEKRFRQIFFVLILVLGLYIFVNSTLSME